MHVCHVVQAGGCDLTSAKIIGLAGSVPVIAGLLGV
jgi:hypothetical protein